MNVLSVLWVALSLSIGWGIRGNFGHEYGAMIPGALASLAAAILSGRTDWQQRAVYFAFFGALGWSLGGSMSYMHVIAYTHSGQSSSVLYGFACLFVIGFLWAALGGAGAALPAFLTRERLTGFFAPLTAIFLAWVIKDFAVAWWVHGHANPDGKEPFDWYDTNWLAALVALVTLLVFVVARRRIDAASSLLLHMAVGWWVTFLLLVNVMGLRMTPPRGDNWAGCLGMTIGMWVYFQRHGLSGLTWASVVTGFAGGFGFATADALKLAAIATGHQTNWHSVLEQTYGFINGLGLGLTLFWLARRMPRQLDSQPVRRWTESYAGVFVLLVITYLNLRQNPETWIRAGVMPRWLAGVPASCWFAMAYASLALVVALLVARNHRAPLAIFGRTALGHGQLFYLVFLWWMVIGNFERALVSFTPERLVTEGVIFVNALLCTVGVLGTRVSFEPQALEMPLWRRAFWWRTIASGLIAALLLVFADWALVRALYGSKPAPGAGRHLRFQAGI